MRWRRWVLAGLVGLGTLQAGSTGADEPGLFRPPPPPFSAVGGQGLGSVPLDDLDAELREKVRAVLDRPTLTARGQPETFNARPLEYRYLLDHPDHAVKLWRRLGARVADIDDQGGGKYLWQDEHGSEVHWQIALRAGGLLLWYAEGKVKPGLLIPAQMFRAVAMMRYSEGVDTRGLPAIRHQVHFLLRCDSRAVALATRIMGSSAPRLAEQYLGQLQMFYGGMAWYLYQDDKRARQLFEQAGLAVPAGWER
jgi:hypothetical protein